MHSSCKNPVVYDSIVLFTIASSTSPLCVLSKKIFTEQRRLTRPYHVEKQLNSSQSKQTPQVVHRRMKARTSFQDIESIKPLFTLRAFTIVTRVDKFVFVYKYFGKVWFYVRNLMGMWKTILDTMFIECPLSAVRSVWNRVHFVGALYCGVQSFRLFMKSINLYFKLYVPYIDLIN